jgi:hypothetical protein
MIDDLTRESLAGFERWWKDEGSGLGPEKGEDREEHMKRVAEIAWLNGEYERELQNGIH